ncbi:MAG: glycosyltransferase [Candidatus Altiarchaeota archaeon]|nr:glycosyltransferase [Candidatus Altiarchaeota archaeon]
MVVKPGKNKFTKPRFTIVIPAYNEAERIKPTLEALTKEFGKQAEIIVVDDGSADNTSEIASEYGVEIIRHKANKGKGAAVKTGFKHARGKTVGFVDADNSATPPDIRKVLEKAEETGAAVGVRKKTNKRNKLRALFSTIFKKLASLLSDIDVEDTQCGCKAFNNQTIKKILANINCDGWIFDVVILKLLKKEGVKVAQVQISWIDMKGSKLNPLRDGANMLCSLIKMRAQK